VTPLAASDLGQLYRAAIIAAVAGDLAEAEEALNRAHAIWHATWCDLDDDAYYRALGWGEAADLAVAACRPRLVRRSA